MRMTIVELLETETDSISSHSRATSLVRREEVGVIIGAAAAAVAMS